MEWKDEGHLSGYVNVDEFWIHVKKDKKDIGKKDIGFTCKVWTTTYKELERIRVTIYMEGASVGCLNNQISNGVVFQEQNYW